MAAPPRARALDYEDALRLLRPAAAGTSERRLWYLFAGLLALLLAEGLVGFVALQQLEGSVAHFETLQTAGIHTEQLGMALHDYTKQMRVDALLAGTAGEMWKMPPADPLRRAATRLERSTAALPSAGVGLLLAGVDTLLARAARYDEALAQAGGEGPASILYAEHVEPLAGRLVSETFPRAERALLDDVATYREQKRRSGRVAAAVLGASVLVALGVGIVLAGSISRTMREAQEQRVSLERRDSELAIAQTIQTRVLPANPVIPGFEIAAMMAPAAEVGGDFYDIRPTSDGGAWLAMGDVTGHGLTSGLVMMMAQSMFAVLCQQLQCPLSPSLLIADINRALHDNLEFRLKEERFMTMVLARLHAGGRLVFAGAHTDVLVFRAATALVEVVPTEGLWLGLTAEIADATRDSELALAEGDIALFYTDGVTEARRPDGEQFDLERLRAALAASAPSPAAEIVFDIVTAVCQWAPVLDDDVSVLVVKRKGRAAALPSPTE